MHDNDYIDPTKVGRRRAAPMPSQDETEAPGLELPSQIGNREFTRHVANPAKTTPGVDTAGGSGDRAAAGSVGPTGSATAATGPVQRSATRAQGAGPLDPEIETDIRSAQGGGRPLDDHVQADMESHFGVDLSAVQVHTDSRGDALSRSVQADAFTTGSDVFFRAGKYAPDSGEGRKLLAHELTHVVQQSSGAVPAESRVSHPDDSHEREAAAVADTVTSSPAPSPADGSTGAPAASAVQRQGAAEDELEDDEAAVRRQAAPEEELEEEEEPGAA